MTELEILRERVADLERRLVQAEPDRNREMLLAVLETSVAAVCVLDTDGRIVYANRPAEGILGLQRSEIVKRTYDDPAWKAATVDGDPLPEDQTPFAMVRRSGEPVYDVRLSIEWPDGRRKRLSVNGAPIHDDAGEIRRVVFSVFDITDQHEALRRLAESEDRYRALFETIPGYVANVGRERRVRYVNRGLPCVKVEEIVGRPVESFLSPEYRESFLLALDRVFETGAIQELEVRTLPIRERDGWFVLRMGPVTRNGDVDSVTVVGIDITEMKAVSDQLRQVQRIESVGRLAGGVAHDFNNLLTAVIGYADMLHEEVGGKPELEQAVNRIQAAADRGAQLTRQLLTFSGRQVTRPRVVDANNIVVAAEGMLRRLIGEDIVLVTELRDPLPRVRVDPAQLQQVLVNLAVNARDAMPAGGSLSIVSSRRHGGDKLPFAGPPEQEWVEIAVRDTGVGMSDEVREKLFEPFFTTKTRDVGTGLGLATSFGIVEQCGGRISVESSPGQGATLRVFLPALPAGGEEDAAGQVRELTRGSGRILLVEDDAVVRRVLRKTLEQAGYRVDEAEDGREGLSRFQDPEYGVDLLITDIVMPRMSGTDLAARMLASRPGAKVLFMSGYATDNTAREMLTRAGVNFVQKPFDSELLTRRIGEILEED